MTSGGRRISLFGERIEPPADIVSRLESDIRQALARLPVSRSVQR
jgi:hypothetical protein